MLGLYCHLMFQIVPGYISGWSVQLVAQDKKNK